MTATFEPPHPPVSPADDDADSGLPAVEPIDSAGQLIRRSFALFVGSGGGWVPLVLTAVVPFDLLTAVLERDPALEGAAGAVGILQNLLILFITPGVILAMVAHLRGGRTTLGDVIAAGNRCFLPLLGWGIVVSVAVLVGLILLVVPGLYLAVIWSLVFVVIVLEPHRQVSATTRSAEVTRGRRWMILAALLVFVILLVGVSMAMAVGIGVAEELGAPPTPVIALTAALYAGVSLLMWLSTAATVLVYLSATAGRRAACPACGYSLAGNVSGACPECGTPLPVNADVTMPGAEPWDVRR